MNNDVAANTIYNVGKFNNYLAVKRKQLLFVVAAEIAQDEKVSAI